MDWYVIVAIAVAIPLVLFPAALVWYLNVSGLFRVILATRARKKRQIPAAEYVHPRA